MRRSLIPERDEIVRHRSNESLLQQRVIALMRASMDALQEWEDREGVEDHPGADEEDGPCDCNWCTDAAHVRYFLQSFESLLSSAMCVFDDDCEWVMIREYATEKAPLTASESAQLTMSIVGSAIERWVNHCLPKPSAAAG